MNYTKDDQSYIPGGKNDFNLHNLYPPANQNTFGATNDQ